MSTSSKLVYTCEGSNGKNLTLSYNYADPDVKTANVKALATGIITNAAIFENAPVEVKSAKIVTTEEHEFNLSA